MSGIQGEQGDFRVSVRQKPRYVDMEKCIACGTCEEKCPAKTVDEFNAGLARRKAIYVPYAQAVPLKYTIDADRCIYFKKGKCRACEKYCPTEAINFEEQEQELTLNAGSVIVSTGFKPFDPSQLDLYQYGTAPNVITSMEFERILSATGPFQGHMIRPSDHKEPKKIAWLQCVGSRDINRCDNAYCSSVCCMYAIKEAAVAKEHSEEELDTAIFFMDMRTYGKDFEKYYDRAREELGVRFIRSRVHSIVEDPESRDLLLRYFDESGELKDETFDLVVLSVGMETSQELIDLCQELGIELNKDNLVQTSSFSPVETSRQGVYVCGTIQEPKDIPASVMEASAAACDAAVSLAPARGSKAQSKTYPQERDVASEEPRIGVFVCNCGVNIGGIVDVPQVAEYARSFPGVAYVEENLFTCSQDTQDKMKEIIHREGLNRIVVAACTPRTHEVLFQETLKDAGLNKYLFEMANIRNQCSWVHSKEKEEATRKAKDLVGMSIARARMIRPLPQPTIELDSKALVVGGGVSGMSAALSLADQGFYTYLLEKGDFLGGNALQLNTTWQGEDIGREVGNMIQRVENHEHIEVFTRAEISKAEGFVGNFQTTVSHQGGESTLQHGATLIAVGGAEHKPQEYLYGQHDKVLTHLDFDAAYKNQDPRVTKAQNAVFIQCVGSREPQRPYCSKVCCTHSIKSAISLKEMNPEMNVFILYRDIRSYGLREELYRKARELGVIFIRYDLEQKPSVQADGDSLLIRTRDHVLGREVEIESDLLVLASAIVPRDNETLAQMYKLPLNEEKFFMEAHAKLRPVEFATEGIYLAGLAHYPKPIEESVAQAKAAASRAAVVLSKDTLTIEGVVSQVDEELCRGCGECEEACPYNAVGLVQLEGNVKVARVQAALCKGCGVCAVACPTGAASICNYEDQKVLTMVDQALEDGGR